MDRGQWATIRIGKMSRASVTEGRRKKEIKRNNKKDIKYIKLANENETDELCVEKDKEEKQSANNKCVSEKNPLYLKIQDILAGPPSLNTTFDNG